MGDLTYAIRSLARSRSFAVASVLTLAIGIGAAATIYSVVNTILFRPLPFPDSDRYVRLVEYAPTSNPARPIVERGLTYPEYLDWRTKPRTLDNITAVIGMSQRMVKTPDGAAGLWGGMTSADTFALMGMRPLLGRTLVAEDATNPDVVVLSHDVWQRHYHSDPDIVGKALEFRTGALLAPQPMRLLTVVGVLPADFEFPTQRFDFILPIYVIPGTRPPAVTTIARLADGASPQAALDEINTIGNAIREPWPSTGPQLEGRRRFELQQLKERVVAPVRPAFRVLMAAVVVVLLIVCANVANLMLARGSTQQREIAVRLALGARRGQIARQVLAEAAVLAAAGGILGSGVAAAGVSLVKQLATVDAPGVFRLMFGASVLPRTHEIAVDGTLLAIVFAISAIACLVFGALPALHLSRTGYQETMGSRGSGAGPAAARLRTGLTVAQLTLATVLLTGAGLLIHSFATLATFDKGYNPANVLAFNLLFPDQYSTARKGETIEALLQRFRANPAVRSAGFARHGILIGEELYIGRFVPPGKTLEDVNYGIRTRSVSDGYLTAMAVPILDGREFSPSDSGEAPPVIVINRAAAKGFFGDGRAVGQTVDWHVGKASAQMRVVGVVEDVRQEGATDPIVPEIFVEYRQYLRLMDADAPTRQNEGAIGFLSFALRTGGDPVTLVPQVRDAIRGIDPNIGIDAIAPMEVLEAGARARERFYAVLLGVFAAAASLLAAIGIYGVLAYAVEQRTREIGVRMALGAERRQVLAMVMRRGLAIAVTGIAAGLVIAAAGARSLESLLFGIQPLDLATFAAVAAGFAVVAAAASYVPARRATKVDPAIALRYE